MQLAHKKNPTQMKEMTTTTMTTLSFLSPSRADFCEGRFFRGDTLAEPVNALSSLFIVGAGIAHLFPRRSPRRRRNRLHQHQQRRRPPLDVEGAALGVLTVLCGLGSVFFHATLAHGPQMLDEVPMLLLLCLWVSRLVALLSPRRPTLVAAGIWSYFLAMNEIIHLRSAPECFRVGFAAPMLSLAVIVPRVQRRTGNDNPATGLLGRRATASGLAAFFFWVTDLAACSPLVARLQLHSVWHALISVSVYNLLEFLHACRHTEKLRAPEKKYSV
jgi:hypothetical protein